MAGSRLRDELLNETLFFARSSFGAGVAAWTDFQMNPVIENLAAEAVDRDSRIFPDGLAVIARAELRRRFGRVRGHRGGLPPSSGLSLDVMGESTTARISEEDVSPYSAARRPGLWTTGEFGA